MAAVFNLNIEAGIFGNQVFAREKTVQFGGGHGAKLLTRQDLPEDEVLHYSRYPFAIVFAILALGIFFWTTLLSDFGTPRVTSPAPERIAACAVKAPAPSMCLDPAKTNT